MWLFIENRSNVSNGYYRERNLFPVHTSWMCDLKKIISNQLKTKPTQHSAVLAY